MNGSVVACTRCETPLSNDLLNTAEFAQCPACLSLLQVFAFPALFKPAQAGSAGERILIEGEASCFYHPQKRAARPCDGCGRFLCPVCDLDINGKHLCPACLQSGRDKGKLAQLDTKRTLYDRIAIALALGPLLIWPMTLFTAPAAIYFAVLTWKRPGSMVSRSRFRAYVAILIAGAQIVGWITLGVVIANRIFS